MDHVNIIKGQRRFAKLHRFLYVIYIVFLLLDSLLFQDGIGQWEMIQIITLGIFAMLDYVLYESELPVFYGNIPMIHIVKYLQLLMFGTVFFRSASIFYSSVAIIFLFIYTMELFFVIDFVQGMNRVICAIILVVPVVITIVMESLYHESTYLLLTQLMLMVAFFSCCYFLSEYFVNYYKTMQMRLFSQNRIISDINETNEELVHQREQIKETNELLGRQKIKLEEAYQIIKRSHLEMSIENNIGQLISSSLELDELMGSITESFIQKLGVDVSVIVIQDNDINKERMYRIRTMMSNEYDELLTTDIAEEAYVPWIRETDFLLDNQVDPEKYEIRSLQDIGSFILLPLVQNKVLIGYILAADHRKNAFSEDSAFFHTIVTQFLVAIQNAKLYRQMHDMATLDGLTGIYNRRHLTKRFSQDLQDTIVRREPLTVALFDIDKFKLVNDTYGHIFGDMAIQAIADLANEVAIRAGGYAGRYGGEEFVIVYPKLNLEDAIEHIIFLQQQVRAMKLTYQGKTVNVRVSIGVTSYPQTCENPADLLSRADWAMYSSKKNGRDRITIDNDEMQKIL